MTIQDIFVEFEKENIIIRKINLGQDLIWKGEFLCTNKKRILFINSNIDESTLVHALKSILADISNSTSSLDKFIHFY